MPRRRRSLVAGMSEALFGLYETLDYRYFRPARDALAKADMVSPRSGPPALVADVSEDAAGARLSEDDIAQIRQHGLDVLLNLSTLDLGGALALAAKYGIWSCHDGEPRSYDGMPPLVAAMCDGQDVSHTVLCCRREADGPARVLCRGCFKLDNKSLARSRAASAWNSSQYVLRSLRALEEHGWEFLATAEDFGEVDHYRLPGLARAGAATATRLATRIAKGCLQRWAERRFSGLEFAIAMRSWQAEHSGPCFDGVRWLIPPRGHYYADPFLYEREGKSYLFFEDFGPCAQGCDYLA